jgi:hypothetical protein
MCSRCEEIISKVKHYEWLSKNTQDEQTLAAIKLLMGRLITEKDGLHIAKRPP